MEDGIQKKSCDRNPNFHLQSAISYFGAAQPCFISVSKCFNAAS